MTSRDCDSPWIQPRGANIEPRGANIEFKNQNESTFDEKCELWTIIPFSYIVTDDFKIIYRFVQQNIALNPN